MMQCNNEQDKIMAEVSGIIIGVEWDEGGNTVAVSIMAPDEQEYLVDKNEEGFELLRFLRQKVKATGDVRKFPNGRHIIRVRQYAVNPNSW